MLVFNRNGTFLKSYHFDENVDTIRTFSHFRLKISKLDMTEGSTFATRRRNSNVSNYGDESLLKAGGTLSKSPSDSRYENTHFGNFVVEMK